MTLSASSVLKMEAVCHSETAVPIHISTRCHNPKARNLGSHCRENLKTYINYIRRLHLYTYAQEKADNGIIHFVQPPVG